jgi:hypothetical protein
VPTSGQRELCRPDGYADPGVDRLLGRGSGLIGSA